MDNDLLETFYKRIMVGDAGKAVKDDLSYYANRLSHTPGDVNTTAFKEGERNLALRILRLCGEIE